MQLNKKRKPLALALATATSTLLAASNLAVADEDVGWEFNTSLLYYGEQGGRVQDASGSFSADRRFEDGRQLSAGVTLDSLTGATPTGATPLDTPQTFTRPSAKGQYTTDPGDIPTDDTFKDSRVAAYLGWTQPFAQNWSSSFGASFSDEFDYTHFGANASLSREFDRGNRTLSVGVAYSQDQLDPEGGVPIPLSEMRGRRDESNKEEGSRDKTVVDLLLGFTQIFNENMIGQLSYSFSRSDDYLNDPYKLLSVLDANGDPVAGPAGLNSYRFENRPDQRTKHSVFAKVKTYVGGGALDTSYRFMTDDWGINSHTFDVRYRYHLNSSNYLEPHVRLYLQSAADFYVTNLQASAPLPLEASADYRLGDFTGTTFGIKYGHRFRRGSELSLRAEWYRQDGNAKLVGVTNSADVFPDMDAVIVQLSYRFHL